MPFDSGTVSYRVCQLPEPLPEDALARFSDKAAGPLEYVKEEPQWGWVSGRHLLETRIDEETAYMGGYLHLCLRQAQRKIPPALLKAECRMAELALAAEKGNEPVNRRERKQIKQDVSDRLLPKMPPQLSGIPFVVDHNAQQILVGATSDKQLDTFLAVFHQTFGFEPYAWTPEVYALDKVGADPNSLPELNFSPSLPDSSAGGTMGQNFLTWLWFFLGECNGVLPRTKLGQFSMMVEGPLLLVAVQESGALESAIRKGMPTLSAEAKAALMVGKKLRQAKIIVAREAAETWQTTVDADTFVFRGMKLPEGEALDPGSVFEERLTNLQVFQTVFFELFKYYLGEVSDPAKVTDIQTRAKAWVSGMIGK